MAISLEQHLLNIERTLSGDAPVDPSLNTAQDRLAWHLNKIEELLADVSSQIGKLSYEVVDTLPTTGESGIVYFVRVSTENNQNKSDEYLWINGNFEKIGSTDIDLSPYATNKELTDAVAAIELKIKDNIKTSDIAQTTGESATAVMSQAAVTANVFRALTIHDENSDWNYADYLTFEQGTLFNGEEYEDTCRVRSGFFLVNKNTHIVVNDGFRVGVAIYDLNKNYKRATHLTSPYKYMTHHIIFGETCLVRMVICKEDYTEVVTVEEVAGQVSVYTENPIVKNVSDINFTMGNYWYDTYGSELDRMHSDMVRVPKNTKISSSQKFNGYIYTENTNTVTSNTVIGWVNEYYFEEDTLLRLVMANSDDSNISDIEILKRTLNMTVVNRDTVKNLESPVLIKSISCDTVGTLFEGIHYDEPISRAHTDFIKVSKGMAINVDDYKYGVHYYSKASTDSYYKSTTWMSPQWFTIDEDCYIRVVCAHYWDTPDMTKGEAVVNLAWYVVKAKEDRPFGIGAHRGLTTNAEDNSLEAFKDAAKEGFKYIETDVWWTSDGLPVLNHDEYYEGTAIYSLTLAEWQARGLCSLVDFLKVCKVNNITPIIEFKTRLKDERADTLYNLLSGMSMLDVIFLCFHKESLMRMLNKHPFDIIWARDYGTIPTSADIKAFKNEFNHGNNVYWSLFGADFNESYYSLFKDNGVKLLYGSANDVETFYQWAEYSDIVLTDTLPLPIV